MITGWKAEALNTAPDSANEIHGDDMATRFGFKGGLVPGVTISAYLIQPAVEAWGLDFLSRGHAHVRVGAPLYDGELFEVDIENQDENSYQASLLKPDQSVSASATVGLTEALATPPTRRGDTLADRDYLGPTACFETWQQLKDNGCLALRYRWGAKHGMQTYLRDASQMPAILTGNDAFANMSYILGLSNWILASNAYMNPWVHLETRSQNFKPIAMDTTVIVEMSVEDFYEKKGHEFVDAAITLFDEADDSCLGTIQLRAIYKLRGA